MALRLAQAVEKNNLPFALRIHRARNDRKVHRLASLINAPEHAARRQTAPTVAILTTAVNPAGIDVTLHRIGSSQTNLLNRTGPNITVAVAVPRTDRISAPPNNRVAESESATHITRNKGTAFVFDFVAVVVNPVANLCFSGIDLVVNVTAIIFANAVTILVRIRLIRGNESVAVVIESVALFRHGFDVANARAPFAVHAANLLALLTRLNRRTTT